MNLEIELKTVLDQHLDSRTPSTLREAIEYSLLAPGKRIRPRLSLMCAEMIGLDPLVALPTALAVEAAHCFTLIHDDLPCMDDDDFRRGQPSSHRKFGEATALLAGDSLLTLSIEILFNAASLVSARHFQRGALRFLEVLGPRGVAGGQVREFDLNQESTLDDVRLMHALKTGALFSAAILIPKDLAGIDDESKKGKVLTYFANELGAAFQVADDLDDMKQDQLAPGEHEVNIGHFLTPSEAASTSFQGLQTAKREIVSLWPDSSQGIASIADEVLGQLQLSI